MTATTEMVSLVEHEYRQVLLKVGEKFRADDEHVDLLQKLGRAKLSGGASEASPSNESLQAAAPERKTFRRKVR